MTTFHFRKPIVLLTVLVGSVAALARQASAQPQYKTAPQLSDAITKVLRSPFHEGANPPGFVGQRLLLPVFALPTAAQGRPTLPSKDLPNAGAPPFQVESSPRRPIGLTTFAGITSHLATAFFLRCYSATDDPGRFTGWGLGGFGSAPDERKGPCRSVVPGIDRVEGAFFLLVPTLATAGGAALGGSGFVRAAGGSALGFAGSVLHYMGMKELVNEGSLESMPILMWFTGGLMHGVTTAYLSG